MDLIGNGKLKRSPGWIGSWWGWELEGSIRLRGLGIGGDCWER